MYIPSQEQFQIVIDNLEKANKIANNALGKLNCDMQEYKMFDDCGTPMCHAGWYSITFNLNSMHSGADLISQHLGFPNGLNLMRWAKRYTEIWGNEHGDCMFASGFAFGIENDVFDLQLIVDHWKGVKERAFKFTLQLEEV